MLTLNMVVLVGIFCDGCFDGNLSKRKDRQSIEFEVKGDISDAMRKIAMINDWVMEIDGKNKKFLCPFCIAEGIKLEDIV